MGQSGRGPFELAAHAERVAVTLDEADVGLDRRALLRRAKHTFHDSDQTTHKDTHARTPRGRRAGAHLVLDPRALRVLVCVDVAALERGHVLLEHRDLVGTVRRRVLNRLRDAIGEHLHERRVVPVDHLDLGAIEVVRDRRLGLPRGREARQTRGAGGEQGACGADPPPPLPPVLTGHVSSLLPY